MSLIRGQIYWASFDEDRRPVIIVSRAELNRGKKVLIVPLTTQKLEERRKLKNCVAFDAGDFGLPKDCVAQTEALAQIRTEILDTDDGPLGELDDEAMRELVRAMGYALAAECEPQ